MNKKHREQHDIQDLLDETLLQHIERLMGSRQGIAALPLDWATISCLTLLAERENEIESLPPDLAERYTEETFLCELSEIGAKLDEDLKTRMQDLIRKGYIEVDENGRFFAKKPTLSMSQRLDRIFPKMPGMSLLAYFIQIQDEVLSGRKELDAAISQFDQMLRLQGVPWKTEDPDSEKTKMGVSPGSGPAPPIKGEATQTGRQDLSTDSGRVNRRISLELPRTSPTGARIMSSDGTASPVEIRDLKQYFTGQDDSEELLSEPDEIVASQELETPERELGEDFSEKVEPEETDAETEEPLETPSEFDLENEPETQGAAAEEGPSDLSTGDTDSELQEGTSLSSPEAKEVESPRDEEIAGEELKAEDPDELPIPEPAPEEGPEDASEKPVVENIDEMIERRIAEFEKDLAMQCPTCKVGKIQSEETEMGKIYYRCSSGDCDFISWGKPFHFSCPQCHNPFLVEKSKGTGKSILQCPRATCHYWQRHPSETVGHTEETTEQVPKEKAEPTQVPRKPRKRVVRRRVVRRKR